MLHASLFSGIGGFDLAAEWAGWSNAFTCEIDGFCRKILKYHFPKSIHYEDIRTTNFTEWKNCMTCSPVDSHASLSALLENEKERRMTVISGRKCFESFDKSPRSGSSAKTEDGDKRRMNTLKDFVCRLIGRSSPLNAPFVAEMMGYPTDWTLSPFQPARKRERNFENRVRK